MQILGIGRLKTKLKMLLMQDRVLGETVSLNLGELALQLLLDGHHDYIDML